MKTKILKFGNACWEMLTEVPGWPDAPQQVRVRRALPVLIPCAVILLLLAWSKGVRDPHIGRERALHQALVEQEKEIEVLRLNCSEQQAGEISTRAKKVAQLILNDPQDLGPLLKNLKREAADRQWEGSFQASDISTGEPLPDTPLIFLQARAKLTSTEGNSAAFPALLALFEQFSSAEKRIDLTRMAIRADEQGRYAVELNLRFLARSLNEKTP